ncbi:MAG: folate-binding protein YgfZ [Cellvibrionaceae bacterium]|nr:folate-binding protein YgfZ [Cellvibrionaceae bacterium]|tara:strand:+ start:57818 stop:58717 length:900 start_codon:yes stop_codon:yes gene_type:complete
MSATDTNPTQLIHFGLLQIQGPDAVKFLQGQATCDVEKLAIGDSCHGAHCTAKGRMIGNFDLAKLNDQTLWLKTPADNLAPLMQSLAKYIVFSKADIIDISADHEILELSDGDIEAHLQALTTSDTTTNTSVTIRQSQERLELWCPSNIELPNSLAIATPAISWLSSIRAGKGWITQATSDQFLPQDLNLQTDAINGISFTKGCYTGQEIVARMHYKGKLKRHLYHFRLNSSQEIAPGAELQTVAGKKSVGSVINVANSELGCDILAVTTEAAISDEQLSVNGNELQLMPLAYAITSEA